jgi:HK97 gp10 family phage protein
MATCKPIGIDNFIKDLEGRETAFKTIAGGAVYVGAGIIADELRKNIEALPDRAPGIIRNGEMRRGVTKYQKAAMLSGMGVSHMRNENGTYDIKIGFQGYDDEVTAQYPKGHPISMIARSVESGTSWLQKTPFIFPAYQKAHARAEAAMAEKLEQGWTEAR